MFSVALSPCPNDTYLFYPWIFGKVGKDLPIEPTFAGIEQLNQWALEKRFPLTKISFPCLKKLTHDYQLLPIGNALGKGVGPKIIANSAFPLEKLPSLCAAIPGEETTAHHLLTLFFPQIKKKIFCPYEKVFSLLRKGQADCGVIIHESRFTFAKEGFFEIADLGSLWESKTKMPLPLGGLAVRRDLPQGTVETICNTLKESLAYAQKHPEEGKPFITSLSQEKKMRIIEKHIALYVTEETQNLSSRGKKAIQTLIRKPSRQWIYEKTSPICPPL